MLALHPPRWHDSAVLSFDDANALLLSIPEGSKIVVSGRQSDKPFTEEGVLVKGKDGSYLLRRQRGIFVAFFGPNITYDSITAKREQSVPPARRAQIIERQLEEEAEGDTVVRHRKPPQQRTSRYADRTTRFTNLRRRLRNRPRLRPRRLSRKKA
jgi:hypothetical protein